MNIYQYNRTIRVWQKANQKPFAYTDGDDVEDRLLETLKRLDDVSCKSEGIISSINDWTSEYHFSTARQNLLRPFDIGPNDNIIELGCGCGALTRYLGETGANVVAVEGSLKRAEITAERCRDLSNVSVYCDSITEIQIEETFDYVLLIGVLEWTPLYFDGEFPIQETLRTASRLLKSNGKLIIAIENQLGLKYFNGCPEDHLGTAYYGIQGNYDKKTPITFGKEKIKSLISDSGINFQKFYYPFPDYKLPYLIISESGTANRKLNLSNLLLQYAHNNYSNTQARAFDEGLAWGTVIENNLLQDLSNSFLISASKTPIPSNTWLAKTYNRTRRRKCFSVETTIEQKNTKTLYIKKTLLHPTPPQPGNQFHHVANNNHYIHGEIFLKTIRHTLARNGSINEITESFKPWLKYIYSHAKIDSNGRHMLPGNFIDCTPGNIISKKSGKLYFFDAEWIQKKPVPFSWVAMRGICQSIETGLACDELKKITLRDFIKSTLQHSGYTISDVEIDEACKLESSFFEFCHYAPPVNLVNLIDENIHLYPRLSEEAEKSIYLEKYENEVIRIKKTISWRITAPLRAIWNFLNYLIKSTRLMRRRFG